MVGDMKLVDISDKVLGQFPDLKNFVAGNLQRNVFRSIEGFYHTYGQKEQFFSHPVRDYLRAILVVACGCEGLAPGMNRLRSQSGFEAISECEVLLCVLIFIVGIAKIQHKTPGNGVNIEVWQQIEDWVMENPTF